MKFQSTPNKNERGAALLVSLLVSTVLLVAGGALIMVTSMSTANTIDSTSEMQAYYGAEAGLQAALNALRGNDAPTASAMPAGMTRISFRNAVVPSRSNDRPSGTGGDPSADARLSRWLPYSDPQVANTRVTVGTNPTIQYDVVISLPLGDTLPATLEPARLLVQATGYGPRGSRKQMSMILSRNAFDPAVPAMMTFVGTPTGAPPIDFESGNSAHHVYSGIDHAISPAPATGLPAFATNNPADTARIALDADGSTTATLPASNIPTYLRTPAAARAFLDLMQGKAIAGQLNGTATYLATGGSGTPTGFTFVKGDYTMGPVAGSGLLIVTGELTTNGATNFSGLLIVLGKGEVNRSGGGGGFFYGANFIAKVDWPAASPALTDFGAPFFDFNGAGHATMQYDSLAVAGALGLLSSPVLGVSEN